MEFNLSFIGKGLLSFTTLLAVCTAVASPSTVSSLNCGAGTSSTTTLPVVGYEIEHCDNVDVQTGVHPIGRYKFAYLTIKEASADIEFRVNSTRVLFRKSNALNVGDRFEFELRRSGATVLSISAGNSYVKREGGYAFLTNGFPVELSDGQCFSKGVLYGYFTPTNNSSKSILRFADDYCSDVTVLEFSNKIPEVAPGDVYIPRAPLSSQGSAVTPTQQFGTGLGG
ncbi:MAG: hypothetical protein EOP06_11690 [Proteobacteria bacterium]|nr:MAG: hypothetical protein EOP06_11690 [Pseudomonadota bacterium]